MSIYEQRSELDLILVRRDDVHLDELARRQAHGPLTDDVLKLLAALTADVDAGLAELLTSPLRVPATWESPDEVRSIGSAGRRRTARAVTAALIVGGLVSVSGVAAAVTGDPLAPYRSIISSVAGEDEPRSQPRVVDDEVVQQQVLSIDAAIEAGELGRAREGIERLRGTLDDMPPAAQRSVLARLAALDAMLARAVATQERDAQRTWAPQLASAVPPGDGQGTGVTRGQTGTSAEQTQADRDRPRQKASKAPASPAPPAPPEDVKAPVAEPVDEVKSGAAPSGGDVKSESKSAATSRR